MGPVEAIVIYVLVWWLAFFLVLPFGVRSHAEMGEVLSGTEGAAPARPRLLFKMAVTTAIAAVLWGVAVYVIVADPFGMAHLPTLVR